MAKKKGKQPKRGKGKNKKSNPFSNTNNSVRRVRMKKRKVPARIARQNAPFDKFAPCSTEHTRGHQHVDNGIHMDNESARALYRMATRFGLQSRNRRS